MTFFFLVLKREQHTFFLISRKKTQTSFYFFVRSETTYQKFYKCFNYLTENAPYLPFLVRKTLCENAVKSGVDVENLLR